MSSFTIAQRAFVVNARWQVLILKQADKETKYDLWDLPGGLVTFPESLRDSLTKNVRHQAGINITIISIPLNITSFVKDDTQTVRIIYLCRSAGNITLDATHSDHLWIDSSEHSHYSFPDEGYHQAFQNYLSHSQISSVEFLGTGLLTSTTE